LIVSIGYVIDEVVEDIFWPWGNHWWV